MLKGFAFVNFPAPGNAKRFMALVEGTQLTGSESKRTLTACMAANQGIEASLAALSGLKKRSRRKVALLAGSGVAMVTVIVSIFYFDPTMLPTWVSDVLRTILGA